MEENYLGVFGHVVVDNIFKIAKLPRPNSSMATTSPGIVHGGTGANIAMVATKLGVKTALASFVGEGFPKHYRNALKKAGIDIQDLKEVDGHSTPQAWIFSDPDQNQITIIDQGPMQKTANFDLQEHTIKSSQIVHIATGRPEYYQRVADLASSLGKKISFDPAQELSYVYNPESFRGIVQKADYLFGNQTEVQTAMAYLNLKEDTELLDYVDVLIITKGGKGSSIVTKDKRVFIPSIKPDKVEDATGAGDAYRAGFFAGMQKGSDLERCGLIGSATASYIVEKKGPQTNIPTWDQIEERIERLQSD
jgi:sugar/nucleoside kinase (ribokinase family)